MCDILPASSKNPVLCDYCKKFNTCTKWIKPAATRCPAFEEGKRDEDNASIDVSRDDAQFTKEDSPAPRSVSYSTHLMEERPDGVIIEHETPAPRFPAECTRPECLCKKCVKHLSCENGCGECNAAGIDSYITNICDVRSEKLLPDPDDHESHYYDRDDHVLRDDD